MKVDAAKLKQGLLRRELNEQARITLVYSMRRVRDRARCFRNLLRKILSIPTARIISLYMIRQNIMQ
jgi:hypothetical protein